MKFHPLTKKELNVLSKVLTDICSIDTKMNDIIEMCGKRQTLIFKNEYRYEFLYKIYEFFNQQNVPVSLLTGSVSVKLNTCVVRIYRSADNNYIKLNPPSNTRER